MAVSGLLLFVSVGVSCVFALRSILYAQLDGTLLHLAEVEAKALKARALADVLAPDLLSEDEGGKSARVDDAGAEIIARMKAGQPVLR